MWFVAWHSLELSLNTSLALMLRSGQKYVSSNGVFWIWNVLDVFGHDLINLTPLFLEIPTKSVMQKISYFYVRKPDMLEPRRSARPFVTKTGVAKVILVREFTSAGDPSKRV